MGGPRGLDVGTGEESLLLTPGDLEASSASVELPFQTALACHGCCDFSDQDCKGLESGDADENGESEELTLATPLHASSSEKYASIRRSNLTRVNVTPPTTPVYNTPVHTFGGTATTAEIESDDSDKGSTRIGCGSSVRHALAKRLTIQKKSSPSIKSATNDPGLEEGQIEQEPKQQKSPDDAKN